MTFLYTTTADVRREAGFTNNPNIDDNKDINGNITAAEAEINAKIVQMYNLPLSSNALFIGSDAQNLLRQVASRLAAGSVLLSQYEGAGEEASGLAVRMIKGARDILKGIADGSIKLLGSDGVEIGTSDSGGTGLSGYPNDDPENDLNAPRSFSSDQVF